MYAVLDRIVIKPIEEKSDSLIDIPDALKKRPSKALVIAAGPGKKDEPMDVQVGETIQYVAFSGIEVTVDGQPFLVIKQGDVLIRH